MVLPVINQTVQTKPTIIIIKNIGFILLNFSILWFKLPLEELQAVQESTTSLSENADALTIPASSLVSSTSSLSSTTDEQAPLLPHRQSSQEPTTVPVQDKPLNRLQVAQIFFSWNKDRKIYSTEELRALLGTQHSRSELYQLAELLFPNRRAYSYEDMIEKSIQTLKNLHIDKGS